MQEMVRVTLILLAAGLLASKAQAMPMTTDITFEIPPEYFATDVADVSPNDSVAVINSLGGLFAGDSWSLLDKTDAAGPGHYLMM